MSNAHLMCYFACAAAVKRYVAFVTQSRSCALASLTALEARAPSSRDPARASTSLQYCYWACQLFPYGPEHCITYPRR